MKQTELKGIITPILTPMNADESINTDELRTQIDRLIDGGVHGIFPFGTNGEGYILNEKEKCYKNCNRHINCFNVGISCSFWLENF